MAVSGLVTGLGGLEIPLLQMISLVTLVQDGGMMARSYLGFVP